MSHSSIAGCYADTGEAFTVEGQNLGPVSLSRILFGDAPVSDTIEVLEDEPETIEIRFYRQGRLTGTRRLSEYTWWKAWNWDTTKLGQPFYPVNGFVEIEGESEHGGAAGIGFYAFGQACLLRKGVDGSLIARQTVNAVGVAVIVPLAASRTVWCRFPPLAEGCPAAPGASEASTEGRSGQVAE